MRLFKRLSTSPQLVSAAPISQDATPVVGNTGEELNNLEEARKGCNAARESSKPKINASTEISVSGTSSAFSARKGISTWGRKVGRRWERLKRSDSSELLSVSGRRRRWSPNRESIGDGVNAPGKSRAEVSPGYGLVGSKRISRVESLRNLFRSNERGSNDRLNGETPRGNVMIAEEEEDNGASGFDRCDRMEKAMSEGALRSVKDFGIDAEFHNDTVERKRRCSRCTENIRERLRPFDHMLNDRVITQTNQIPNDVQTESKKERGARLGEARTAPNATTIGTRGCARVENVRRVLFNDGNTDETRWNEQPRRSANGAALEDLICALRLGCDESGYDSDSTRAGADSPDSENPAPALMTQRSFSITSDDYQGIDLSLPMSTPKKRKVNDRAIVKRVKPIIDEVDNKPVEDKEDDTGGVVNASFDESMRTETTLMSDDDDVDNDADTDSCDENTFPELRDEPHYEPKGDSAITDRRLPATNTRRRGPTKSATNDSTHGRAFKRIDAKNEQKATLSTAQQPVLRLDILQRGAKSQAPMMTRARRASNASVLNLLDNAASPCKDSPPASKVAARGTLGCVQYYSPKRPRSNMESDGADGATAQPRTVKRPPVPAAMETPSSGTLTKTLARRELKTVRLEVDGANGLGMKLERREAARPFYVVAALEKNGRAAKSGKIRIGDEVVRVCGRRLRGMSAIEARNALKNSTGTVELQIAGEAASSRVGELGDAWTEPISRARSDSEVCWTLRAAAAAARSKKSTTTNVNLGRTSPVAAPSREIVGALAKSGKSISMSDAMNVADRDNETGSRITGMRKFQVMKKRNSMPAARSRRTTLSTTDLLTVTLEKGATKKLGFTIVGGSDSNRGNMGIFVKDVMFGGQAAEEGTLRAGDEILAINGQLVEGLTHAKALQLFKVARPGKLMLHVARRETNQAHKRLSMQPS